MSNILSIGLGIIIIPTLLTALSPLIDYVFTDNVVGFINDILDNIEIFIGSRNLNLMLIMIALLIFIKILKRILKIVKGE